MRGLRTLAVVICLGCLILLTLQQVAAKVNTGQTQAQRDAQTEPFPHEKQQQAKTAPDQTTLRSTSRRQHHQNGATTSSTVRQKQQLSTSTPAGQATPDIAALVQDIQRVVPQQQQQRIITDSVHEASLLALYGAAEGMQVTPRDWTQTHRKTDLGESDDAEISALLTQGQAALSTGYSASAETLFGQALQHEAATDEHEVEVAAAWLNAPETDIERAFLHYKAAADRGNAEAQHMLAFFYSIGLGVPENEGLSVLYDYFSAQGGSTRAMMALGYRHAFGYSVPQSCTSALEYYQRVAGAVVEDIILNPVGGVLNRARLHVDENRQSLPEDDEDVVEYYTGSAEMGDVHAQVALGQMYLHGIRGVEHDGAKAARLFEQAASQGSQMAQVALGVIYLYGYGRDKSYSMASRCFNLAAEAGHGAGHNWKGYMQLHGLGVEQDSANAMKLFKKAAALGNADAQFHLGTLYFRGDGTIKKYSAALQYFTHAANQGHSRALYNLGMMHVKGLGTHGSCVAGLQLLKTVAERGRWSGGLHKAHGAYLNDDVARSLLTYARLAHEGQEVAQSNAAWLLDSEEEVFNALTAVVNDGLEYLDYKPVVEAVDAAEEDNNNNGDGAASDAMAAKHAPANVSTELRRRQLAYHFFTLASEQGNVDALRKIGDYAYYGHVDDAGEADYATAAEQYQQASDINNAQSMYNLGYMHEHGIGIQQDFHLAKRYYDMALVSSADAYFPVQMALAKLYLHEAWVAFWAAPVEIVAAHKEEVAAEPVDAMDFAIYSLSMLWETFLVMENYILSSLFVVGLILLVVRVQLGD